MFCSLTLHLKDGPFYWQVLLSLPFSACSVWGYLCWPQHWIESRRLNGRAKSTLSLGHHLCAKDPDCHGLDRAHQEFWMATCPPSPDLLARFGDMSPRCASGKAASWTVRQVSLYQKVYFYVAMWITSSCSVFIVDVIPKQCKAPQGERRRFWTTA